MGPLDRRAQSLLPDVGVTTALEQVEARSEAAQELLRGEDGRPCGGELECERQVVEASAELVDRAIRLEVGPQRPSAREKELPRIGTSEHRNRVNVLAAQLQPLTARDHDIEVRAYRKERREFRRSRDDVLEVVEQEEQAAIADHLRERTRTTERA